VKRGVLLAGLLGALLCGLPAVTSAAPACFASPKPVATSNDANAEQPCRVLARVLGTSAPLDIAWIPGQVVNSILKLTEGGFAIDTFVLRFRVTQAFSDAFTSGPEELVRLSATDSVARTGSWWVPKEFVTDASGRWLSLASIEEILALPPQSNLQIVAYSGAIDPGTMGYVGIVAPAFGHKGGGIQFWFPREPVYTKDTSPPSGVAH